MPGLRKSVEYPKSRSPSGRRPTQYPSFNVGCFLLSLPANHNRTESPTALLYSWAEPAAFSVTTVERLCFKILFGAPDSLLGVEFPKRSPHSFRGEIRLCLVNQMLADSKERCISVPCTNMTNLHFHGLHVSPGAPQDDVITTMAMPGQVLHYLVNIPLDQAPGLYWYHTHPHGESYQQDLDGMSGAIVIDGMERYVPAVQHMRERILVLRDRVLEDKDPAGAELRRRVEIPAQGCGASTDLPKRIFTVNGEVRPQIAIAPGERQFWRIVNASPDLYADLQIDTEQLEIVALDGMPLSFHHPKRRMELTGHLLVPPAGRLEAIVSGPKPGVHASLRTLCFDTGPDGDPNPAMVLADMVERAQPALPLSTASSAPPAPL